MYNSSQCNLRSAIIFKRVLDDWDRKQCFKKREECEKNRLLMKSGTLCPLHFCEFNLENTFETNKSQYWQRGGCENIFSNKYTWLLHKTKLIYHALIAIVNYLKINRQNSTRGTCCIQSCSAFQSWMFFKMSSSINMRRLQLQIKVKQISWKLPTQQ